MNEQEIIAAAMGALGRRKKTMSKRAIEQRKRASKKSVIARRNRGTKIIENNS